MKIDWAKKLTSRKLWMAISGLVSGLIVACGGSESWAKEIGGLIMAAASVVGYMIAEGLVDAENAAYLDEPEKEQQIKPPDDETK